MKKGLNRPTFAGKNSTQLAMKLRDLVEDECEGEWAICRTAAWPDGSSYKGFVLVSTIRDEAFEDAVVSAASKWMAKNDYDAPRAIQVEAKT